MTIADQVQLHLRLYDGVEVGHGDIEGVLVEYWPRNFARSM